MTETNRIEYKKELTDSLEKEVIAFLNYKEGGSIFIGISDNGEYIGLADSDKVQLQIKDRLKNNIQPSCLGLFDVIAEQRKGKILSISILQAAAKNPIIYENME